MIKYLVMSALAALGVVIFFHSARRQKPADVSGVSHLGWPLALQAGAALAIPFSAFVVWAAMQAQPSQRVTAAIVATCFVLGSLYLAYSIFLYRVWWTDEALFSWHLLGGTRSLRWADMEDWRYIGWVQAFQVSGRMSGTPPGNTVRIWYSPLQSDLASLGRVMVKRTNLIPPVTDSSGPDQSA